jgi:hypothetical protein
MELNTKKLTIFHHPMKQLLVAILANFLLLPMCGSVLAFSIDTLGDIHSTHHSDISTHAHTHDVEIWDDELITVAGDSTCEHSGWESPPNVSCCDTGHTPAYIATPEIHPTEKNLKIPASLFSPNNDSSCLDVTIQQHRNNFPTAPPSDKHDYINLVGIIKCLN